MNTLATKAPTVIIVGPPWPHSGTSRLIQNQIEFYRSRGYETIFLCVPIHCSFTESYPEWDDIKAGMQDLGADRIFFAPIDYRRFVATKYTAWLGHAFRGTALDWIVFTADSAQLSEDAIRIIRHLQVDLIHVNHIFTLGFARRLRRQVVRSGNHVPMILETHDIQADLLEDRREINPWTHRHDTLAQLLRSEISLLSKAKVLVHCSVDDLNFFKPRLPHKPHVLALPTVDESFVSTVKGACPSGGPIDMLFVGQSTDPNRAGMKWFCEEVWPLISDRDYRMKIVGKIDMLMRKEQPEVYRAFSSYFVGPSTELAPYYRAARCVFAPMVSGTGVSIKTVEALALGKPFIGTSKAYRGLPMDRIEEAGLRAHDTPQDFAEAIVHALSNEQQAAAASRAAYESIFSKQAAFASRDEALKIATTK